MALNNECVLFPFINECFNSVKTKFPEIRKFPQFSRHCSHFQSNNKTELPFYMICYYAYKTVLYKAWEKISKNSDLKIKIPCFSQISQYSDM